MGSFGCFALDEVFDIFFTDDVQHIAHGGFQGDDFIPVFVQIFTVLQNLHYLADGDGIGEGFIGVFTLFQPQGGFGIADGDGAENDPVLKLFDPGAVQLFHQFRHGEITADGAGLHAGDSVPDGGHGQLVITALGSQGAEAVIGDGEI